MSAATAITNLLYRYAELMDAGDFAATAALFAKARIRLMGDQWLEGAAPMEALWTDLVKRYDCGTPRTRHVITNPILDIDEAAGTATCRSYYTVFQQAPGGPLQPICAGRYHDRFARDGEGWHFAERDYSMMDLVGDLSAHLNRPVN